MSDFDRRRGRRMQVEIDAKPHVLKLPASLSLLLIRLFTYFLYFLLGFVPALCPYPVSFPLYSKRLFGNLFFLPIACLLHFLLRNNRIVLYLFFFYGRFFL